MGLPVDLVSLFGFAAEQTRFTQGAKAGTTYTAAPQGLMIADKDAGLVNVWGEEEAASAAWKNLDMLKDLRTAIGR